MKKLNFADAEKAKQKVTATQQQEIKKLYENVANKIADKAKKLSKNPDSSFKAKQAKELQKQLEAALNECSVELNELINRNLYIVSDAVVGDTKAWLKELGFPENGIDAALSSIDVDAVNRVITGQIYESGWSLSSAIWTANQQIQKDAYQVVAAGMAENKGIYYIAKDLEKYVRPETRKSWNLRAPDGKLIYPKQVDYAAQRLARTLTQHAYQQTFVSTTKNNPFILEYVWIANGSRVCDLCKERDGQHYKKDELPLDHPNGMCVMDSVQDPDLENKLADWFNSPDGFYPEIDDFARNFGYDAGKLSVDGFVSVFGNSDYKSYQSWFKSLDVVAQKYATQLKDESGLSWQKFYELNVKTDTSTQYKELKSKLEQAKYNLSLFENKTYSGIWKNDVTISEYEKLLKSGSIQAKKDYYENQIIFGSFSQMSKSQAMLNLLADFEKQGKNYANLLAEVEKAQKVLDSFGVKEKKSVFSTVKSIFSNSLFSQEEKDKAKRFNDRYEADKYHRPLLDKIWKKLTKSEKYSVWEYTRNSNPINKSLSGYHDSWSRTSFLGLGNTRLNYENAWRSFSTATFAKNYGVNNHVHYQTVVKDLTNVIEKSKLSDNVFLVRGSDKNGFAGIIEGSLFSFDDAKMLLNSDLSTIKTALEGQTFQNHAYTSTGVASGTGFSGDVLYEIYAPKGTKAIYAEPASYFGNTVGMKEKVYKTGQEYYSVGGEAEVILQRGTQFRITEIIDDYGTLRVKMEVVNQPDYFKSGLEHTHNNGATEYTD